jgi:hypothetical protein
MQKLVANQCKATQHNRPEQGEAEQGITNTLALPIDKDVVHLLIVFTL